MQKQKIVIGTKTGGKEKNVKDAGMFGSTKAFDSYGKNQ